MEEAQVEREALETDVEEQEVGRSVFRIENDDVWFYDKKFKFPKAYKILEKAQQLESQEKLGELSIDDFLLVHFLNRLKPGDEEGTETDPGYDLLMKTFAKQTHGPEQKLLELKEKYKKLYLTDKDMRIEA